MTRTLFLRLAFSLACALLALGADPPAVQNSQSTLTRQSLEPYVDPSWNPNARIGTIRAALPARLMAPTPRTRRVLVLTFQTRGQLHLPGAAGLLNLLREAEKKYRAFELTEAYTSAGIDAKTLSRFDAVVLNNISIGGSPEEDDLYNKLLPGYVANGGGLFADHGVALLYLDHPDAEFNRMLGGFSSRLPSLRSTVHPTTTGSWTHCSAFPIRLPDPENPLIASFREASTKFTFNHGTCWDSSEWLVSLNAPQELADELYVISPLSNQDGSARAIVMVDPDKVPRASFIGANEFSYALIWIKNYGKGRVFVTALGHDVPAVKTPAFVTTFTRGAEWAATGQVTVPAGPELAQ